MFLIYIPLYPIDLISYNNGMGIAEDFSLLLSDFNKVEERVFLGNINDFAGKNKEAVTKTFALLLMEEKINIQLKYLVLKSMGELKYREFIPMIRQLLDRGDKVRIVQAAIDCLVRINTMEAYKTIALFLRENPGTDFKMQVEEGLKELLSKNRLLYHFDVFYRDNRGGDVKGVEKSGEFLVKHLPEIYVKDILPALSGKFYDIRYGALQILENKPNPLYYMPIYNHFKAHAQSTSTDEKFFLMLSQALVTNAALSKLKVRIFPSLKERLQELEGNKRLIFAIMLLKLNTPAMIAEIIEIYPRLDYIGKRLVFDNLDRRESVCYLDFLRRLLKEENDDDLSARIMEILINARDFAYIFQVIKDEGVRRKEMLLEILLQHDPPDLQEHLKECIQSSSSQEARILYLSLEYLLRHAADDYFAFVKSIFFSGVPNEIKTLIIRNIAKFSAYNRKVFMESVFKDIKVIDHFKKDFLLSLLGLLSEKKLDKEFEDMLLNRVLVMMEESRIDDIIHFIYFFDKYEVNNIKDLGLIIDELRLLQDMILKSGRKDDLVRGIHVLIKSIEKRARLKGLPHKKLPH